MSRCQVERDLARYLEDQERMEAMAEAEDAALEEWMPGIFDSIGFLDESIGSEMVLEEIPNPVTGWDVIVRRGQPEMEF